MKKQLTIILTTILAFTLITAPAFAGSKQRHRWEGVAIGAAAATLLAPALLAPSIVAPHVRVNANVSNVKHRENRPPRYRDHRPARERKYTSTQYRDHRPNKRQRGRGHWEARKVWVDPIVEQVWNPGHYNKRNRWVPGHYIEIEKSPGYWTKERVWASRR